MLREDEAHFPTFAITQHMITCWMPLNQAMSYSSSPAKSSTL